LYVIFVDVIEVFGVLLSKEIYCINYKVCCMIAW